MTRSILLHATLFAAAVVFSTCSTARAGTLYSVTYENNRINTLDSETGALLNSYAPPIIAQNAGGVGLAANGTTLYYVSLDAPTIYVVAGATGQLLNSFPSATGIDSLGYGTTNSFGPTLFALEHAANRIHLLNPATGASLTSYVTSFDAVGGIDFNSATGLLYVSDSNGVIRTLDPTTGAVLNSFTTGIFQTGIGFVGGRLFTASQFDPSIFERNPVTGAIINSFPSIGGSVGALAGVVPEPSTLALAAIGALGLLIAGRRKRGCLVH